MNVKVYGFLGDTVQKKKKEIWNAAKGAGKMEKGINDP